MTYSSYSWRTSDFSYGAVERVLNNLRDHVNISIFGSQIKSYGHLGLAKIFENSDILYRISKNTQNFGYG